MLGNSMFEAYFELLYPFWVGDSRVIIGNLKFEVYFEDLYPFWVVDCVRTLKDHHSLSLVTTGCP